MSKNEIFTLFNGATMKATGLKMVHTHERKRYDYESGQKEIEKIEIHMVRLTERDYALFEKHNISKEALDEGLVMRMVAQVNHKTNKVWRLKGSDTAYVSVRETGALIYYNLDPKAKIKHLQYAQDSRTMPMGWESVGKFADEKMVVVTSGFKEVFMLISAGIPAIKPLSESAITPTFVKDVEWLIKNGRQPIILFDADDTGRSSAEDLSSQLDIPFFDLKSFKNCGEHYRDKEMKDLADFCTAGIVSLKNDVIPELRRILKEGTPSIKADKSLTSILDVVKSKTAGIYKEIEEEENRWKIENQNQPQTVNLTPDSDEDVFEQIAREIEEEENQKSKEDGEDDTENS